ncbi:MAG: hypothetical protein V4501_08285 [Pseudomonadota bacterium]
MKDHEKREFINAITNVSVKFAGTQQLRERISEIVLPVINNQIEIINSMAPKDKQLGIEVVEGALVFSMGMGTLCEALKLKKFDAAAVLAEKKFVLRIY